MARQRVQLPLSYYADPDADRAIALGFVYVGIENLDPITEANRQTVFLIEEDGNEVQILPAGQPLNLGAGGIILYQGSPVQVECDDVYSLRVDDDQNAQKYYWPSVTGAVDVSVPDLQSATFYPNDVSSASNAYAVEPPASVSPFPNSLLDDQPIIFRPSDTNTGSSTLNVKGDSGFIGAKSIYMPDGATTALPAGLLAANTDTQVRYDSGLDGYILEDWGVFVNDFGIPAWQSILDYSKVPSYVTKNSTLYKSLQTSGPNFGGAKDPVSEPTYWLEILENQVIPNTGLHQDRMTIANSGSDPFNDIDIEAGSVRAADDSTDMALSSVLTKQINANWAVGTNAGGFPSGLLLGGADWYHVFSISKDDGADTDGGFDTAGDALNLLADAGPSGYTKYRHRGWIYWDGSQIVKFFQIEDHFIWDVPVTDFSGAPTTVATTHIISAPPDTGVDGEVIVKWRINAVTVAAFWGLITSIRQTDTIPTATEWNIANHRDGVVGAVSVVSERFRIPMDGSSSIRSRFSTSSNDLVISTNGWFDPRRE